MAQEIACSLSKLGPWIREEVANPSEGVDVRLQRSRRASFQAAHAVGAAVEPDRPTRIDAPGTLHIAEPGGRTVTFGGVGYYTERKRRSQEIGQRTDRTDRTAPQPTRSQQLEHKQ